MMEQNTQKFRLRLNLFDGVVLVLALAAGAFLLWNALKPESAAQGSSAAASTVRYTVQFRRWKPGDSALIQPGDKLADSIKNFELGQVTEAVAVPSETLVLDHGSRAYVLAETPGYEDVLVTVEAPASITDSAIVLGGGYELRVGATAYIKGEGYMASGPIVSIEREGIT